MLNQGPWQAYCPQNLQHPLYILTVVVLFCLSLATSGCALGVGVVKHVVDPVVTLFWDQKLPTGALASEEAELKRRCPRGSFIQCWACRVLGSGRRCSQDCRSGQDADEEGHELHCCDVS